jgi:MYXO-CTERM domain-containing protein
MKRAPLFASILLLTVAGLAQQPASSPQDRPAYPNDQTYNRPVETGHSWGGWGLLGLLGLGGLLGRRRDTTAGTTYTRDERTYGGQQRRVG